MIIYLDHYFFMNFLMDMLLLYVTGKVSGVRIRFAGLCTGAVIGGVYSCIILVLRMPDWIVLTAMTPLASVLMVKIAYSGADKKQFWKLPVIFYGAACLCSGVMNMALRYSNNRLLVLGLSVLLLLGMAYGFSRLLRQRKSLSKRYRVVVRYLEREIAVTALLDTGNSLTEPITQRPVHILDMRVWEQLTKEQPEPEGAWVIPYHSVGKKQGILFGKTIDNLVIKGETGETTIEKPILAIYPGELSGRKEYQMLLHPAAMDNKEC